MITTTQINFNIINKNLVKIKQEINFDKIFDEWIKEAFTSKKWKNKIKKINSMLNNLN